MRAKIANSLKCKIKRSYFKKKCEGTVRKLGIYQTRQRYIRDIKEDRDNSIILILCYIDFNWVISCIIKSYYTN